MRKILPHSPLDKFSLGKTQWQIHFDYGKQRYVQITLPHSYVVVTAAIFASLRSSLSRDTYQFLCQGKLLASSSNVKSANFVFILSIDAYSHSLAILHRGSACFRLRGSVLLAARNKGYSDSRNYGFCQQQPLRADRQRAASSWAKQRERRIGRVTTKSSLTCMKSIFSTMMETAFYNFSFSTFINCLSIH